MSLSQSFLTTLFRFACQYAGRNIEDTAYKTFVFNYKLPYEEVTVPFIDRLVDVSKNALDNGFQLKEKVLDTLVRIAGKKETTKDVRQRIIYHAGMLTDFRARFEKAKGTEWKEKLEALQ